MSIRKPANSRLKQMAREALQRILGGDDRDAVLINLTSKGGTLALFEFGQAERAMLLRQRRAANQ